MKSKLYKIAAICFAVMAIGRNTTAQTIYTFAGSTAGYSGDGGPATAAQVSMPTAIKYHNGFIYVIDANNEVIRKIDAVSPYNITTIAGSQSLGFSGDGGPATAAETYLGGVGGGIVADNSGNVYFSDIYNDRVRKVSTAGIITTIAGGGSGGDGGAATAASLNRPFGLAIDGTGNMYVCEEKGHKIRKIDAVSGIISTIAGTGTRGYSGDGGPATAAELEYPEGIALDASGNVYYSDYHNNLIRKITVSTGLISTYATGFNEPSLMEFDQVGNLFLGTFNSNGLVYRVSPSGVVDTVAGTGITSMPTGDGGPAIAAGMGSSRGVTITSNGSLLVSDRTNHRIRVVTPATAAITGTATLCAGGNTTLTASIPGAAWMSGTPGVATVSAAGVVTGVAAGTATITYVAGLVFGTQIVTVSAPVVPAITAVAATLAVPAVYTTYQWSLAGTPIPGATSAAYSAAANGTYAVAVTDAGGCGATSSDFVFSTLAVQDVSTAGTVQLFPNPAANGQFTINVAAGSNEPVAITVTSILGEKVYETYTRENTPVAVKIDAPAGIYIVHATSGKIKYSGKVIIK